MAANKLTPAQRDRIRTLVDGGKSIPSLARKYSVTTRAIYDIIGRSREMPHLTPQEREYIADLRQRHSQRETAEISGRARATIQRLEYGGRKK